MAQEFLQFRKLNTLDNVDIPTHPENRHITDITGFILFLIAIIVFIPLLVMTILQSDIRRIQYKYDDCGNMCGQRNPEIPNVICSGADFSSQPWYYTTDIQYYRYQCFSKCPFGTKPRYTTPMECARENVTSEPKYSECMGKTGKQWWKYIVVFAVTIILAVLMLLALRYFTSFVVWVTIVVNLLLTIGTTIILWINYYYNYHNNEILTAAILSTICSLVVIIIVILCFNRISLLIFLFKEATKAVFAMPQLICVTMMSTLVEFIILAAFIISTTWMATARELHHKGIDHYEYEISVVMICSILFNVIVTLWTLLFWNGLIYMTIAGSIAAWFFVPDKESPVSTSFSITFRYHIGTAALGSFIILVMTIVKAIIESLAYNKQIKWLIEWCCEDFLEILKALANVAYIETAIYGQPFCKSGRRAVRLLFKNFGSSVTIFYIGTSVLCLIVFSIVCVSTIIAVVLFNNIEHYWLPCLICLGFNWIVVYIIFGVIDIAMYTLFICFCEDKAINDGVTRPYRMPQELMIFVEHAKEVYEESN